MHYSGLAITGNDETKVLAIARKLCDRYNLFIPLNVQLNSSYVVSQETIKETIEAGKIPLVLVNSSIIKDLIDFKKPAFLTVFINSPQNPSENTGKDKKEPSDEDFYTYTLGSNDETTTADLLLKLWENAETGGIIPQEVIKLMIKSDTLLESADLSNASGAAYDLTLDDEYYQNGSIRHLDTMKSFIIMEPGDYALVGSSEIANLPRDVAGRFGLSVSLFMQGIILSNGPQIDPGFNGRLYCLLFNTSSQQFQLKRGQHYATIEFIKLLEPTIPYKGKYQHCTTLSQYLPRSIPSSAIGELRKDVKNLKREKLLVKTLPTIIALAALIIGIYKLIS